MHTIKKSIALVASAMALALSCADAHAQQPIARAELDSMTILVGGQVGLNLSVAVPKGLQCHILSLPDTLTAQVEVVEALEPDTLDKGDLIEYVRRYLVTSFDTGLHYVPPITVAMVGDGVKCQTSEFALSVVNPFQQMAVNEEGINAIYDINGAEDSPFQWRELLLFWPWAVGVIVAAGLVYLIIFLRKKYGGREVTDDNMPQLPDEPCEVTALRNLERIRGEKLWLRNQVKEFYTDLTETLRTYIGARYGIQAKESTSAQIMDQLREPLRNNKHEAEILREILEQADLVKFAKMEPLADENDKAVTDAIAFVNTTTEHVMSQEPDQAPAADVPQIETVKSDA